MNEETQPQNHKKTDTFVFVEIALVIVLVVAIVYVYVHLQSRTPNTALEVPQAEQQSGEEDQQLTTKEKHAILDALRADGESDLLQSEKQEILVSLESEENTSGTPELTEGEKMNILKQLQN